MNPLYDHDLMLKQSLALERLCGIDEAGRGALAGPVVIASVILDFSSPIEGLDDSKKLSAPKREQLYKVIISKALAYHIVEIPAKTIDEINILQATLLGFQKAYRKMKDKSLYALVDGLNLPKGIRGEAIVYGDALSASIAAASILAKVHRDSLMDALDSIYPEYGFKRNKGYGTKAHYEALKTFGDTKEHRQSFRLF